MMTIEKTAKELRRRIEAAGLQEISLTMACNGDVVTIRPCHSGSVSYTHLTLPTIA